MSKLDFKVKVYIGFCKNQLLHKFNTKVREGSTMTKKLLLGLWMIAKKFQPMLYFSCWPKKKIRTDRWMDGGPT